MKRISTGLEASQREGTAENPYVERLEPALESCMKRREFNVLRRMHGEKIFIKPCGKSEMRRTMGEMQRNLALTEKEMDAQHK